MDIFGPNAEYEVGDGVGDQDMTGIFEEDDAAELAEATDGAEGGEGGHDDLDDGGVLDIAGPPSTVVTMGTKANPGSATATAEVWTPSSGGASSSSASAGAASSSDAPARPGGIQK